MNNSIIEFEYITVVYDDNYWVVAKMVGKYYDVPEYQHTLFCVGCEASDCDITNYYQSIYYDISNYGNIDIPDIVSDTHTEIWSTNPNALHTSNIKFKPLRYVDLSEFNIREESDFDFGMYLDISTYHGSNADIFLNEYQASNKEYMKKFSLKIINGVKMRDAIDNMNNCRAILTLPVGDYSSQDMLLIYMNLCYGRIVFSKECRINMFPGMVVEWNTMDELSRKTTELDGYDYREYYRTLTEDDNNYNEYIKLITNKIQSNMITLCAIAKNEYNYIKDWVEYNLTIGFDKIIVYDNNDVYGERYDELLASYINDGKVEIRDRRGQTGQQLIVYNEYYKNDDFDWVCFLDLDEFITFGEESGYKTIQDLVNDHLDADSISMYWKCYGDNGSIYNNGQKIYNRFNEPLPINISNSKQVIKLNAWPKTIYKKGNDIEVCEHYATRFSDDFKQVDVLGNKLKHLPSAERLNSYYKVAYVKHYITKTLDEWFHCKLNRGHAGVTDGGITQEELEKTNIPFWNYGFDTFFEYNSLTEDKMKYLKSHGYSARIEFKPKVLICTHVQNQYQYDLLMKYLNIISQVCNTKLLYVANYETYTLNGSPYFPYSDFYHSGHNYDLQPMTGLTHAIYEFSDDIHCFINIGYPLIDDEENRKQYEECLESLFGNTHKVRMWLQKCIENKSVVISNNEKCITSDITNNCPGLIDVAQQFLPMTNGKISDYFIKYNTFISPYKPIYDNIINKDLWMHIETKYIMENLKNNILCEYQAFQIVYPALFDNLQTV